jgi:hypothetical protein
MDSESLLQQSRTSVFLYFCISVLYTTLYRKEKARVPFIDTRAWRLLDEQNRELVEIVCN